MLIQPHLQTVIISVLSLAITTMSVTTVILKSRCVFHIQTCRGNRLIWFYCRCNSISVRMTWLLVGALCFCCSRSLMSLLVYLITCNQRRPHNRPQLQPSNKDLRCKVTLSFYLIFFRARACAQFCIRVQPQPPMPLGPLNNSGSNEVKGASVQNGIALENNWWGVCCGTVMSQTSAVRESISYYDARWDVSIMCSLLPALEVAYRSACTRVLAPACVQHVWRARHGARLPRACVQAWRFMPVKLQSASTGADKRFMCRSN